MTYVCTINFLSRSKHNTFISWDYLKSYFLRVRFFINLLFLIDIIFKTALRPRLGTVQSFYLLYQHAYLPNYFLVYLFIASISVFFSMSVYHDSKGTYFIYITTEFFVATLYSHSHDTHLYVSFNDNIMHRRWQKSGNIFVSIFEIRIMSWGLICFLFVKINVYSNSFLQTC